MAERLPCRLSALPFGNISGWGLAVGPISPFGPRAENNLLLCGFGVAVSFITGTVTVTWMAILIDGSGCGFKMSKWC